MSSASAAAALSGGRAASGRASEFDAAGVTSVVTSLAGRPSSSAKTAVRAPPTTAVRAPPTTAARAPPTSTRLPPVAAAPPRRRSPARSVSDEDVGDDDDEDDDDSYEMDDDPEEVAKDRRFIAEDDDDGVDATDPSVRAVLGMSEDQFERYYDAQWERLDTALDRGAITKGVHTMESAILRIQRKEHERARAAYRKRAAAAR